MANRFVNPFPQFLTSTPTVLNGAKLFFYAKGTANKLNTYQRSDLTGPANANPVILNAAGFPPVNIFLQNLSYRVVLAPSTDTDPPTSPIWVADDVYASDFSTIGRVNTFPGNPNGFVAGTAGSGTTPADEIFDTVNKVLYICTTTGDASTAVWTAINTTTTVNVPPPQGRLTLTSLTPVLAGDTTASTVLYTPYQGNLCPIYNGTAFAAQAFTELSLTLNNPAHAANTIYDVFAFMNGSTITLCTGPAWSNSGAGTGARGTGGGSTQLGYLNGILVNAFQITGRNGVNTFTIPALTATYLGSIFIDSVAGQVSCHTAYGQSRKYGLWNAYNRKPIMLRAGDGTASWSYTTNTWRASNNAAANSLTTFAGLAEEIVPIEFSQRVSINTNAVNPTVEIRIGIGVNSTSAPSGLTGENSLTIGGSGTPNNTQDITPRARHMLTPGLGINTITSLEIAPQNAGLTSVFNGTGSFMQLEAIWNG